MIKIEELNNYEGNENEFKNYYEILKKDFKAEILYYDNKVKKYSGNIVNNLYDGRGILYNESGDIIYDVFFKEGKYEGFWLEYKEKLLKYEGFFSNGEYEGKGNLYFNNIKIYEGHFHEGYYHGIGIKYFNNGEKARKLFFDQGLEDSFGILYDNNKEIYSGELSYNKPKNGKNIVIFKEDGNIIYKGNFSDFEYDGKGILYINDSYEIYFEGIFKFGKYEEGKLYDLKGKIIYQGKFKGGKPIKGKNIKIYDLNKNLIYHGEFKDGKYSGFSKIYKNNNLYFEGNFENDEIKGKGVKYYKNGNKHIEGNFVIKNRGRTFDFEFKEN